MNEDLIIRKKRKLSRKIVESSILVIAWALVLIVIIANISLMCHVTNNDMVTIYILLGLSTNTFNDYIKLFLEIFTIMFVIGFACYINREWYLEQKHDKI